MTWQRYARLAVACVGLASAVAVGLTLGRREPAPSIPPPERTDPAAVVETVAADVQQLRGAQREYRVESERQLTYEDGATRFLEVRVLVENRDGEDFSMDGAEARADAGDDEMEVSGGVTLRATDGLIVTTPAVTFQDPSGMVVTPGRVNFERRNLRGSGVGMSYSIDTGVLTIDEAAVVSLVRADGTSTEFRADTATLDSESQTLRLTGAVRIVSDGEVLAGHQVVAFLDEGGEYPTAMELRDGAEVAVAEGIMEGMTADAIDITYGPGGQRISRVAYWGGGYLTMRGAAGTTGRRIDAGSVEMRMHADGALDLLLGGDGVRVAFPLADGVARIVEAGSMEAVGDGVELDTAEFLGRVLYREQGAEGPGIAVASSGLTLDLTGSVLEEARFTGEVRFTGSDLVATAGSMQYIPSPGTLRLATTEGRVPHLETTTLEIDAAEVVVAINPLAVDASGMVRTSVLNEADTVPRHLPEILGSAAALSLSSDRFRFAEADALIRADGQAALWQGETELRGDRIVLNQSTGDLVVEGTAVSRIPLDGDVSVGAADRIVYTSAARMLEFTSALGQSMSLSGPFGVLVAESATVQLDATGERVSGLDALSAVELHLGDRAATGQRLRYTEFERRYTLDGTPADPVQLHSGCRVTVGTALVFFADSDRLIVDGNDEVRTRIGDSPGCADAVSP